MTNKLLVIAGLLATLGCGGVYAGHYVRVAPPAPIVERGYYSAPGPGYVWCDGYWDWRGGGWYWMRGSWRRPPRPHAVWVPGYWERHSRYGYRFRTPRWR